MATLSKPVEAGLVARIMQALTATGKRKVFGLSAVILIVLLLVKLKKTNPKKAPQPSENKAGSKGKGGKGNVDMVFVRRIMKLIKIVIPSFNCTEVRSLLIMSVFLVLRTYLSIYVADVQGKIIKGVIDMDWNTFFKKMINLVLCAVPASFINSYLEFLNKKLALDYRSRLTYYFHEAYLKDMMVYQISNLDARIANPDQRLTADIERWGHELSHLYSNLSKPLLDIVLFSKKLSEVMSWKGPAAVVLWYVFSGYMIRIMSPSFGRLVADEQRLEGQYRGVHSDIIHHAEEIAFYQGQKWEKTHVHNSFEKLITHTINIMYKRLYMGIYDTFLVKYGISVVNYAVVGLPVFGDRSEEYLKEVGTETSKITRDYVRNSSLLVNLTKAIGRLVYSYKELQQLAGYTTVVYEFKEVVDDLSTGNYKRNMVGGEITNEKPVKEFIKGEVLIDEEVIRIENVPILTPSGEKLISPLNIELKPGRHCIVLGPNGCGKSSLFRIIASVWPAFSGKITRPSPKNIFYVPQRSYLPGGSLRDQIIYPHSKLEMLRRRIKDEDLKKIMDDVFLGPVIEREGGLDAENDWIDVLSGGEKQRMALGRLLYHSPKFAILDDCTSAVSMDVEAKLYQTCKNRGITLFTVSMKQSLVKHHDYLLKFDEQGGWTFSAIDHKDH